MGKGAGRTRLLWAGSALALGGAAAAVLPGLTGADAATSEVTVVHGTTFPDPSRTGLTLVGCADLYGVTPETPQPMIGQGPGDAPIGDRSLAYDLNGGNALGAMYRVGSVVTTRVASMAVHPWTVASTGVAYVAYQDPDDAGTGLFWLGRTELSAPGGSWSTVNAAGRTFTWTQYDTASHQPVAPGPATAMTVADFASLHGGDGPGVYTIGLGCNGTAFNLDDLRITTAGDSNTFDLEGLTTAVTMSHGAGVAEGAVILRGTLTSGSGEQLPDATLRLESSDAADGVWTTVGAFPVHHGVARATVVPETRTWYRWRFVDRPLAAGSLSPTYVVPGVAPSAPPTTDPSSEPSHKPSAHPSGSVTSSATARPSQAPTAAVSSSASPASPASPAASDSPAATPSEAPTDGVGPAAEAESSDAALSVDDTIAAPRSAG